MKRYLLQIIPSISIAIFGWLMSSSTAHAGALGMLVDASTMFGYGLNDFLAEVAAWISHMALTIMGVWITVTGALLNVSITLTLQIKDFVDSTQGVYLVWQTIRDVSGMFIIFMLLYASFKIILSRDGAVTGVGNLIKNVVIMGVMINFSFFIVGLLIDASNIISMTLYRGIVAQPTSTIAVSADIVKNCRPQENGKQIEKVNSCVTVQQMFSGTEGGLSDIFLTYLRPQSIYNSAGTVNSNDASDAKPLAIIIQGIIGSVLMFVIGLSFLLAALAFIIRFIILILLLAFSPIWFASWVIPQLEDKAKEFIKQLNAQLIFMPVYLLLLYASLRILTSSSVFTNPSGNVFSGTNATFIPMDYVILAVNDFFILFLLNVPLVVAFSMGGLASEWVNTKKFGAEGIWKNIGAFTGRNTSGRLAHIAQNSGVMKNISARSPLVGNIINKQLGKAANFGFGQKKGGYKDTMEANQKDYTKLYEDVSKASAAERAKFDDTDKTRDRDGKTDLQRHIEARQKEYFDNISKPTILSRMVNKVKGAASAVPASAAYAANVVQGYTGNDQVVSAVGSVANAGATAINAAGTNVSASFSASENAAMLEIKKKRDADRIEAEAKMAKKENENLQKEFDAWSEEHKAQQELLEEQIQEGLKQIKNHEEILNKAKDDQRSSGLYFNVDRAKAAQQEAAIAEAQRDLDNAKAKKVELEKALDEANQEKIKRAKELANKKAGNNKKISADEARKQEKHDKDLIDAVTKAAKESSGGGGGGGGSSGGGGSKPK